MTWPLVHGATLLFLFSFCFLPAERIPLYCIAAELLVPIPMDKEEKRNAKTKKGIEPFTPNHEFGALPTKLFCRCALRDPDFSYFVFQLSVSFIYLNSSIITNGFFGSSLPKASAFFLLFNNNESRFSLEN